MAQQLKSGSFVLYLCNVIIMLSKALIEILIKHNYCNYMLLIIVYLYH